NRESLGKTGDLLHVVVEHDVVRAWLQLWQVDERVLRAAKKKRCRGRGAEGHTHERPEICPVNLDSLFGSFDQRGRHDAYQRRRGRSEQQIGAICDRDQDDKNDRRDRINEIEATADATAIAKLRHVDLTSGSEDVRGMNGGAGCERRRAASSSHTPTPLSQTM